MGFFAKIKRKFRSRGVMFTREPGEQENQSLSLSLAVNQKIIQGIFNNCVDVTFRSLLIPNEDKTAALIIFINGLVDDKIINQNIIKSLVEIRGAALARARPDGLMEVIKNLFLQADNVSEVSTIGQVVEGVLTGHTVLLLDGSAKVLKIGSKGWESRPVAEPVTEGVVRGPRGGFNEDLRTNTALLRRIIKSPQLKLEQYTLGRATRTEINIAYLKGTVNPKVVQEVRRRIVRIDVDSILESGYVEELIEDTPLTLFPQIEHSERPDKVAAAVLEGRVAIFVDGTPFVLVVPTIIFQFYQSSEDYYERYPFAFLVRWVRYLFSVFALLLPSVYVAVTTFHQEMIPTPLLFSIAAGHEGVPFPAIVEALLMEVTFEALREAGIRLPRQVGQAVSIVGALVIGQAAVQAGIVSPAMVIVVALTGISSFCIPAYNFTLAIRILRFGFLLLASILGLYGVLLGLLILVIHLASLRSFGVPYFTPFGPLKLADLKDTLGRVPWWAMGDRPSYIGKYNRQRQKFFLKPGPPDNDNP